MVDSWDVFVCHATEDKGVVRPLAQALQRGGLSVWYDDFTLRLGDSLREALDRGLRDSSFGLVVLSPAFFSKQWPQWELNALVTRQLSDKRRVIIPVWHNITADEVKSQSPPLADLIAANTASGLEIVVEQVLDAVQRVALTGSSTGLPSKPAEPKPRRPSPKALLSHQDPTNPQPSGDGVAMAQDGVVQGVVKWWSHEKGFGFLTADDGTDVFVHFTHLLGDKQRPLAEGARVEFEIEQGDKGPKAVNVRDV